MNDIYIAGILGSFVLTLMGILYKIHSNQINSNKNRIEEVDKEADDRLDKVENRLTKVETKIEK